MNDERNDTTSEKEKEELITEEDAEKIRLRRQKRAEARKRRKRKERWNCFKRLFFEIIVICFLVFLIKNYIYYPIKTVSDGTIYRNLTEDTFAIPDLPKEERLVAWDSELPKFVEKDIKEAREKGYTICYTIGSTVLKIAIDENGEPYLRISNNSSFSRMFENFTNFSIYKDGDDVHVYGYTSEYAYSERWFVHLMFFSAFDKSPDYTTLTYDSNLPLNHEDRGVNTLRFKDYSLYYDEDTQTFSFYSEGKVISSKVFYDSVDRIELYKGIIITQNHMLYRIFAYIKDGLPELKFVYVADGLELSESKWRYSSYAYLSPIDKSYSIFPIFKKDEEYYITIPNNWEDYDRYCLSNSVLSDYDRNTDYSFTLVNLEDAFVSAEFEYSSSEWSGENDWEITITFNINGRIYTNDDYCFYGYDQRIKLSDKDVEKLSVKVNSIDEIEEQILRIREAYESYY